MLRPHRPRRSPPPARRLALALAALALAAATPAARAGVDRWTVLGPPGGRSLALAFDPATAGGLGLYVAGDAGLWKSADGGATWWHLTADGAGAPLAVDPADPRIVYTAPAGRIDRSPDGGLTWTTVRSEPGDSFAALAADPRAAGTVYALSLAHGALKSVDFGWSWSPAGVGLEGSGGLAGLPSQASLAVDPARSGALFASTAGGVFRSLDGARHWSPAGRGPAGALVLGRVDVAADPGGAPSVVYAFVGGASGACLLRSADGGGSWAALPPPAREPSGDFDCRDAAVDPLDAGRLYLLASDGSVYRSRDGGATWLLAGRLPGAFAALRVDPRAPDTVYALSGAATYDGIAASVDGGSTWRRLDRGRDLGFDAMAIDRLAAAAGAPGTLYALAADGVVWKSGDYGARWAPLALGLKSFELAVDPFDAQHVVLAVASGLLASRDGGATWSAPPGAGPPGVTRVAFDPYVRGALLAGTADGRVVASADGGAAWTPLAALPAGCASCPPAAAAFAFDPVDPRHLYAVVGGGLYASSDGGGSWTAMPAAGRGVQALLLDPSAPRTLYAGGCDGLTKSPDGGATWRPSGRGIAGLASQDQAPAPAPAPAPPACVERLAIDPRRPDTLYAEAGGRLSGVYRSLDAGGSWAPLAAAASLPADAAVTALVLEPTDSARLYAATAGLGVLTGRFAGAAPLGLGPLAGSPPAPRFTLRAAWRDFAAAGGPAAPVALGAASGYFWFFTPDDLELAVKVLDGDGVNGHQWVFYGGLTDLQWELTVADSLTGAVRSYFHPAGTFASAGDVEALPALPPRPPAPAAAEAAAADPVLPGRPRRSLAPACAASSTVLCLGGGRFRAELARKSGGVDAGAGAVLLSDESGYFWFFAPAVVELAVKVIDGRPLNGHFWVFYGALTDADSTLRVEDLATGAVRTYENPAGLLSSAGDTAAF